jgi:outer membrane protein OmpA-like peptidoglycan-associated protein
MNMRVNLSVMCILLFGAVSTFASPNKETPIVNRFGMTGLVSTQSAKTLGKGRLAISAFGNVSQDKKYVESMVDLNDTTKKITGPNINQTISALNFALGYGFTPFLDFSIMLPVYAEYLTRLNNTFGGKTLTGIGDLEISLKFQYPPYPHKRFFEMAYFGGVSLPTGNGGNAYFPRHVYYLLKDTTGRKVVGFFTSKKAELDMKMLWTFDFDELGNKGGIPVEAHINYGVRWTNSITDHIFLLNVGLSYRPVGWLTLFSDFNGETRFLNIDKGFKIGGDPLFLTPGFTITPPGAFFVTIAMDIKISSDDLVQYTSYVKDNKVLMTTHISPQYRFVGGFGWAGFIITQDKDKDGIKDNVDRCPTIPEDFDGFEDIDGCPDYDNDLDGIPDSLDRCPNVPEDKDGFEDADGCPDNDNDSDGITDSLDKCPDAAEDMDGFEDVNGCPDFDNDLDGIPDSLDKCINEPEDKDSFQDEDGCPDPDNDKDGIADSLDKCPNEPEVFNGLKDDDGCPDTIQPKAKEIQRGRVVLRGVNFETGKAILTGDSYTILDQVYESLVEWPEIKIEIVGHTDAIGGRQYNRKLSFNRANSVRSYLTSKGIAGERLIAIGKGPDEPIADNKTADGRAENRRVELHRID